MKAVASDSLENLGKINEKIQNEYHDLKKSSEWDRFTIAFYGETNAGKSTLIEALRLLWKEEGKLEEQERFKTIQQKSGLTQEAFDNIQRAISDREENIIKSQNTLADLERKHAYEAAKAQAEIQRLTALLQEISDRQGWWKKILVWFLRRRKSINCQKQRMILISCLRGKLTKRLLEKCFECAAIAS